VIERNDEMTAEDVTAAYVNSALYCELGSLMSHECVVLSGVVLQWDGRLDVAPFLSMWV